MLKSSEVADDGQTATPDLASEGLRWAIKNGTSFCEFASRHDKQIRAGVLTIATLGAG
jgi:hypothetical protein